LVPVFSIHRFLCLGRSSCRWSSCSGSPNLSRSELAKAASSFLSRPAVFWSSLHFLLQETSLTLRFSCGLLFWPVFPAPHKGSAGRCFGPRRSPVSKTLVFSACVSPTPIAVCLGCQLRAAACPGSPARWSCCSVGFQSSALICFVGSVLLKRRVRVCQFGNAWLVFPAPVTSSTLFLPCDSCCSKRRSCVNFHGCLQSRAHEVFDEMYVRP
jgi:hypothetical protein